MTLHFCPTANLPSHHITSHHITSFVFSKITNCLINCRDPLKNYKFFRTINFHQWFTVAGLLYLHLYILILSNLHLIFFFLISFHFMRELCTKKISNILLLFNLFFLLLNFFYNFVDFYKIMENKKFTNRVLDGPALTGPTIPSYRCNGLQAAPCPATGAALYSSTREYIYSQMYSQINNITRWAKCIVLSSVPCV